MKNLLKSFFIPFVLFVIFLSGCVSVQFQAQNSKNDYQNSLFSGNMPPNLTQGAVVFFSEKKDLTEQFQNIAQENYDRIVVINSREILDNQASITISGVDFDVSKHDESFFKIEKELPKPTGHFETLFPFLKKYFPQATITTVLIRNADSSQIKAAANFLDSYAPPRTLMLVPFSISPSLDPLLHSFQQNYFIDVVANMDLKRISNAQFIQEKSFELLQEYLSLRKALLPEIFKKDDKVVVSFQSHLETSNNLEYENKAFLVTFGDIMLGRAVRSRMDKNGLDYPFQNMDFSYLKYNDLLLANLEGPIAKNAIKTSKTIAFRFLPDVAPLLKKYQFDVLSLANNHALDMGLQGYTDTHEILNETGIVSFGNPKEITEESVATLTVGKQKIAFLGLEEVVYKINDEKAVEKVKELAVEGYKVIPYVHWGVEYVHKPNNRQKDLAHKLIDAGAFALIAHHPHVVQAYETYNGRPIFYSLGNAIFDQEFSAATQEGLSLALSFDNDQIEIFFLPIKIDRSQMRLMNQDERKAFLERFVTFGEHSEEEKEALLTGRLTLNLGS